MSHHPSFNIGIGAKRNFPDVVGASTPSWVLPPASSLPSPNHGRIIWPFDRQLEQSPLKRLDSVRKLPVVCSHLPIFSDPPIQHRHALSQYHSRLSKWIPDTVLNKCSNTNMYNKGWHLAMR
jgi:hypothetical protein